MFEEEIIGHQLLFGPISDDNGFALLVGYVDADKLSQYTFETNYLDVIDTPDEVLMRMLEESPGEQIVFKDAKALNYLIYDGVE